MLQPSKRIVIKRDRGKERKKVDIMKKERRSNRLCNFKT
jgi:hypothetical protein